MLCGQMAFGLRFALSDAELSMKDTADWENNLAKAWMWKNKWTSIRKIVYMQKLMNLRSNLEK